MVNYDKDPDAIGRISDRPEKTDPPAKPWVSLSICAMLCFTIIVVVWIIAR